MKKINQYHEEQITLILKSDPIFLQRRVVGEELTLFQLVQVDGASETLLAEFGEERLQYWHLTLKSFKNIFQGAFELNNVNNTLIKKNRSLLEQLEAQKKELDDLKKGMKK